jgi:hypothetical protein
VPLTSAVVSSKAEATITALPDAHQPPECRNQPSAQRRLWEFQILSQLNVTLSGLPG